MLLHFQIQSQQRVLHYHFFRPGLWIGATFGETIQRWYWTLDGMVSFLVGAGDRGIEDKDKNNNNEGPRSEGKKSSWFGGGGGRQAGEPGQRKSSWFGGK